MLPHMFSAAATWSGCREPAFARSRQRDHGKAEREEEAHVSDSTIE